MSEYPRIRVGGGPRERGRQYGEQACGRIQRSIDAYSGLFAELAGWEWAQVCKEASRFEEHIAAFNERYLEEMRGMAEGAGVLLEDVLALNVRTEVINTAYAAKAASATNEPHSRVGECTSIAVLPRASANRHTLLAQNWDWYLHSLDTVVVLEVEQDDGPDFVTIVEAGLLAKLGMNSSGVGVCVNALVSSSDSGHPGVPYHVLVRALLDAETLADGLGLIEHSQRSFSQHFVMANEDGAALGMEAAPGDYRNVFLVMPDKGLICHTNHFISPSYPGPDLSLWAYPCSPFRLERAREMMRENDPGVTVDRLKEVFRDHVHYPMSVCYHPDPRLQPSEQGATTFSVIMDLPSRQLHLADGYPCETPYRTLDYSSFLAKPSLGERLLSRKR